MKKNDYMFIYKVQKVKRVILADEGLRLTVGQIRM